MKFVEKEKKYKIGYAPGVYDLFHIGHLNLIRRAKEQSEYLLVGVLCDELVVHFKGKKPYIPLKERMEIIAALKDVDGVVEVNFSNTFKMDAWKLYHYDAYFSGNDHEKEWEEEQRALQAVGSGIVYLSYTQGISSTMIKKQIQENQKKERLYLFGAGKIGKQKLAELTGKNEKNSWQVAGFLDNQREKHLTRIQGIPVYRPEDLRTLEGEENYSILITMKDENEARKQLEQLGLKNYICGELS